LLAAVAFAATADAAGGSAHAWGENDHGELGTGSATTTGCLCVNSPTPVNGISNVTAVAAGNHHSLALRSDGTVVAWGDNSHGQLGNGTISPSSGATPVPVPGLSNVVAIAVGDGDFSLALRRDGTVVAWGDNSRGELGDGAVNSTGCTCIASPVQVSGLSHVVAIAAGNSLSMALLGDGTVRTWGANFEGQLGNGTTPTTTAYSDTPVAVTGLARVVAVAAGDYFGLALLADGTLRSWGDNSLGALGTGTVSTTGCACIPTPTPVKGVSNATAIAAGYEFGLALLPSGRVSTWGWNPNGQLGNGTYATTGCQCVPSPVAVSGLSNTAAIAAGYGHVLALLANGTLMSWGYNRYGQVGNGTTTSTGCLCITSPVAVSAIGAATAVAGGSGHSLALAGPAQTLNVDTSGAGAGTVGGAGILCPLRCSRSFPQGAFAVLRAEPSAGGTFAGFTGACRGTAPCQIQMNADESVVATFGPPKGTRITAATVNKKKRSASFSFAAPGAITGFECELIKSSAQHHKKRKARFSQCSTPKRYKHLKPGKYTFKVRARDIVGADPTPAKRSFKI
jgi:alpha-tubulin suppressor-like RCC1 family protein